MERRPLARQAFAYRLNRAVEAKRAREATFGRPYGLRTIASRLDPENPERTRRNLQRLMAAEYLPRPDFRVRLAAELEVDEGEFLLAEDSLESISRDVQEVRRLVEALTWTVQHGAGKETVAA